MIGRFIAFLFMGFANSLMCLANYQFAVAKVRNFVELNIKVRQQTGKYLFLPNNTIKDT
jgi:uncharacterized membrane protein